MLRSSSSMNHMSTASNTKKQTKNPMVSLQKMKKGFLDIFILFHYPLRNIDMIESGHFFIMWMIFKSYKTTTYVL